MSVFNQLDLNSQLSYEINKLKAGNFQDYQSFYGLSAEYIYRLICSVINDENQSSAILTDVYNSIYQSIGNLQDNREFYVWAGRLATNTCVKYVLENLHDDVNEANDLSKTIIANQNIYGFTIQNSCVADSEAYIPAGIMKNNEVIRILREKMENLPIITKVILQHYYYEDMTIEEIAANLGFDRNTVYAHLQLIRRTMQDVIAIYPAEKNEQLFTMSYLPVLWFVFAQTISNLAVPALAVGVSGAAAVVNAGVAGATGNAGMTGASGVAASGAANVTGAATRVAGSGAAGTGGAVVGTGAAKTGAAAVGKMALGAKVGIGVAATAVAVGAGVGVYHIVKPDDAENEPIVQTVTDAETTIEITEDVTVEITTEEVIPPEELYSKYLEEVLIPEKGITQTAFSGVSDFSDYESLPNVYTPQGICSVEYADFNSDEALDMLVISFEQLQKEDTYDGSLYDAVDVHAYVYTAEGNEVVLKSDAVILSSTQNISQRKSTRLSLVQSDNGRYYIVNEYFSSNLYVSGWYVSYSNYVIDENLSIYEEFIIFRDYSGTDGDSRRLNVFDRDGNIISDRLLAYNCYDDSEVEAEYGNEISGACINNTYAEFGIETFEGINDSDFLWTDESRTILKVDAGGENSDGDYIVYDVYSNITDYTGFIEFHMN